MSLIPRSLPSNVLRRLAIAGISGPTLFLLLSVLAQSLQPDYDPIQTTLSFLALGQFGWLQMIAFIALAISLMGFYIGLYFGLRRVTGLRLAISVFLLGSFGMLLVGIFRTDGLEAAVTIPGYIHSIASQATALCFLIGLFLITPVLRRNQGWRSLTIYTLVTGFIALGLEISKVEIGPRLEYWVGLHERILVAIGLLWTVVLSRRLLILSSRADCKEFPCEPQGIEQSAHSE